MARLKILQFRLTLTPLLLPRMHFFSLFHHFHNLVIGGTISPHREIDKLTWISPNGRDKNQIDHIIINGKWRRSLQDVCVMRDANVASDHHLIVANIKLKCEKKI